MNQTPMNRIALGIEYDGTDFYGWQQQANVISVQEALQTALSRVADEPIHVFAAGRTDRGVHATHQVTHFNTTATRSLENWLRGTNRYLPDGVRVVWAKVVDNEFHARFSAVSRRYLYITHNAPGRSGLFHNRVSHYPKPLDLARMQAGAQYLLGEHDFSSFRAAACQAKSPIKTVHHLELSQYGDLIYLDIKANAFLHHMVRNIAGILHSVGAGEATPESVKTVLEARDRCSGDVTAVPEGLYFIAVEYPENYGISADPHFPLLYHQN
tara:strand:- start:2688 stop:3494 length:807 start_codon:yes stop_codon:yes gene_type:complete